MNKNKINFLLFTFKSKSKNQLNMFNCPHYHYHCQICEQQEKENAIAIIAVASVYFGIIGSVLIYENILIPSLRSIKDSIKLFVHWWNTKE